MKKTLLAFLLVCLSISLQAQVLIDFDQLNKTTNVRFSCRIIDAKSSEPIQNATLYLIPVGDTNITHFTISDQKGIAKINDVVPKKYEVNVEMIGYLPFKKVEDLKGWEKNIGDIKLEENPEYIDASTITALGNPMTISKDTLIYNASAFRVGQNDMLADLLKRMPGMEVAEDGTVTVNGEKVDKVTVGGKTFFFNDPTMAVKNLPAKIVDKIKVVDKTKDSAKSSGLVATKQDKEKVMDVQLKEEYKQGFFGNVKLGAGTPIANKERIEKTGVPKALYSGNGLAAAYSERDQLTVLGNAGNVNLNNTTVMMFYGMGYAKEPDPLQGQEGISTNASLGANYNTDRLKGFDSNASVNYSYKLNDVRRKSFRTSFIDGSDLFTDAAMNGLGEDNSWKISASLEKKGDSKIQFKYEPSVDFATRWRNVMNTSTTSDENSLKNSSTSTTIAKTKGVNYAHELNFGLVNLGKKRRNISFNNSTSLYSSKGKSSEKYTTDYGTSEEERFLLYDNNFKSKFIGNSLTYNEPISEKFAVNTKVGFDYASESNGKLALNGNDLSHNDYYTGLGSKNDYNFNQRLTVQYAKDGFSTKVGGEIQEEQTIIYSKVYGNESKIGKGDWYINWSPFVTMNWDRENSNMWGQYSGYNETPYGSQIMPVLNLMNPVQASVGNVFLKSSFTHNGYFYYRYNNRKNFSNFSFNTNFNLKQRAKVEALWFDEKGNRFSIPVNSEEPSKNISIRTSYNTPLDKGKKFYLSLDVNGYVEQGISYQGKTALRTIDRNNFDYDDLMRWFWGTDGSDFYSGRNGFAKSKTNQYSLRFSPSIKYRSENLESVIYCTVSHRVTKYSLDKTANMAVTNYALSNFTLYRAPKGWEFDNSLSYSMYRGYAKGYGDPTLVWNLKITKEIKSVSLFVNFKDILNQSRNFFRNADSEYVEDVYTNSSIGRCVLFGISFNFGKMNASNNKKAQSAMWKLMF